MALPRREAGLFQLWLEQRLPPEALVTAAGEPVRVLYRGRPGGGAGPDFRDARVSIGGGAVQLGDVELHLHAADFRRHGHGTDDAYRRVVLHVVLEDGGQGVTPLPGGGAAPVLALRGVLEENGHDSPIAPWREPCHTALDRLGTAAVLSTLYAGGERRLRQKAAALADEFGTATPEAVLYRAIFGALGLSRNVEPFRLLADVLPASDAAALVRGGSPEEALARVRACLETAAGFDPDTPPLGELPWRLSGLRSGGHPRGRLAGLAALLVRHRDGGLVPGVLTAAASGPSALVRALLAPGIGRGRAVEMAVNAVLPFLLATGEGGRALALVRGLSAAGPYGPLTLLTRSLAPAATGAGRGERPLPLTSALAQQGSLALHHEWCRRGGCGVCPLS